LFLTLWAERMKAFHGVICFPGFALGPAHICATWSDLVATQLLPMPAIVVAPYLDARQLGTIAEQRIYGIALERGSYVDPMWEELSSYKKPTMLGCRGILADVRQGDLIAMDGEEGVVVVRPEGRILDYCKDRKGSRVKRDPHWVTECMRRMADSIRLARFGRGYTPPLDLPTEANQRLLAIARKVAGGTLPTSEEDSFVQELMNPPRVEPEELPEIP
jgi:hypothetical protein